MKMKKDDWMTDPRDGKVKNALDLILSGCRVTTRARH